jgi:hypothetical protein
LPHLTICAQIAPSATATSPGPALGKVSASDALARIHCPHLGI